MKKFRYSLVAGAATLALFTSPVYAGEMSEEVGNRAEAVGDMAISGLASPYMLVKDIDKSSRDGGVEGLIESTLTFPFRFTGKVLGEVDSLIDGEPTGKVPYEME